MFDINLCTIYERGARFTLFIGLFVKMFARSCNRRCILASLCSACNPVQSDAGKCKCAQNGAKLCSAVKYCVLSLLHHCVPPEHSHILKFQEFRLRMRKLLSLQRVYRRQCQLSPNHVGSLQLLKF